MASNGGFNPIQMLSSLMDNHDDKIDAATMQSYISFVSFLSLLNIYQDFAPEISRKYSLDGSYSQILAKFANKVEPRQATVEPRVGGGQDGIASLLSSIPPEAMAKVSSMLGGSGGSGGLGALGSLAGLSGLGGGSKKSGSPLTGLISMAAKNPALISMLAGGLGGGGGLGSLLGGGGGAGGLASLLGGNSGGGGLGSLLGGGGGAGLASLLGGGGGSALASLLGGGGKGAAAAPLASLLGSGGGKQLNSLLGGKGLEGLSGLASFAPLLPYMTTAGKNISKKIRQSKRKRRDRRKSKSPENMAAEQMQSILEKSNLGKYAPLVPHLVALAGTANTGNLMPMLLPFMMQNSKKIKQQFKSAITKTGNKMPVKTNMPTKQEAPIKTAIPVKKQVPVKASMPTFKNQPITNKSLTPNTKMSYRPNLPLKNYKISTSPKIPKPI